MNMQHFGKFTVDRQVNTAWHLGCLWLVCGLIGCGSGLGFVPPADELVDGNRGVSATELPGKRSGEPNGTFVESLEAIFDTDRIARLQGTVSAKGDMDVYMIGPLSAGDRLIVDTETPGSILDVAVAIFDSNERLVYHNDDRGGFGSDALDAQIDWIVRHSGEPYFLVVTHSGFAASNRFAGSYRLDVEVDGGLAVPQPVGQSLLLDFDGGVIDSSTIGSMTLDPFDAANISSIYAGQTEAIKEMIVAIFEQNFERFNVTIRTSDDPTPQDDAQCSTVFFGGFDSSAFGIAEGVDLYNVDFCDDAIIFTESFRPAAFRIDPTAQEMGIALGNIASHEAGHLLGLNHVDEDRALMDDESAADVFLTDQEFMDALLSSDIMPIGTQDAVLLLDDTVGPNPGSSSRRAMKSSWTKWGSFGDG